MSFHKSDSSLSETNMCQQDCECTPDEIEGEYQKVDLEKCICDERQTESEQWPAIPCASTEPIITEPPSQDPVCQCPSTSLETITSDERSLKKDYVYPYPVDHELLGKANKIPPGDCRICAAGNKNSSLSQYMRSHQMQSDYLEKQAMILSENKKKRKKFLLKKVANIIAKLDKQFKRENKSENFETHKVEVFQDNLPWYMRKAKSMRKVAEIEANSEKDLVTRLRKINEYCYKKYYMDAEARIAKPPKYVESIRFAVRVGFVDGRLKFMVHTFPEGSKGEEERLKAESNPDVMLFHIFRNQVVPYTTVAREMQQNQNGRPSVGVPSLAPASMRSVETEVAATNQTETPNQFTPSTNERQALKEINEHLIPQSILKMLTFRKESAIERSRRQISNLKSMLKLPTTDFSKLAPPPQNAGDGKKAKTPPQNRPKSAGSQQQPQTPDNKKAGNSPAGTPGTPSTPGSAGAGRQTTPQKPPTRQKPQTPQKQSGGPAMADMIKNADVRLDKLINLVPTIAQVSRRPEARQIPLSKILTLSDKKEGKKGGGKGELANIPRIPVSDIVHMIVTPVFDLQDTNCYTVGQISSMLRFEIERPKNAESKLDLSLIVDKIHAKQLMLEKLQARKRQKANIMTILEVKRGCKRIKTLRMKSKALKLVDVDLEQFYGRGRIPHSVVVKTLYTGMRARSIPKNLKGKEIYKMLLKNSIRKFKVKGQRLIKKDSVKMILDDTEEPGESKQLLDNDRLSYVRRITEEIVRNAIKMRHDGVKPSGPLKKLQYRRRKLIGHKAAKKLPMITYPKPPEPKCKEKQLPQIGTIVSIVLNRLTSKNDIIVETIIFEDVIGMFCKEAKCTELNLTETKRILSLMERYRCVDGQYKNTLFLINNCTYYDVVRCNFIRIPYMDCRCQQDVLKNFLTENGKESSTSSSTSSSASSSSTLSSESSSSSTESTTSSSTSSSTSSEGHQSRTDVQKLFDGSTPFLVVKPQTAEIIEVDDKPTKVQRKQTVVVEAQVADTKQRRLYRDSLIMKKVYQIGQTRKKSRRFISREEMLNKYGAQFYENNVNAPGMKFPCFINEKQFRKLLIPMNMEKKSFVPKCYKIFGLHLPYRGTLAPSTRKEIGYRAYMTKHHYDNRRFLGKLCRDERNEEYTGEDETSSDLAPSDDDKSTTSTYKRAKEVARRRLEAKHESDTCLCKEAELANKMTRDFRIADTCEECGYTICKNCFGRIIWVFKKLPSISRQKKDKRVYIQECLCTSDLQDYRYKLLLMKYQGRMCYNCFIDIPVDHYVYFGMQHAKKCNVDFMKKYIPITARKSLIEGTSSFLEGRRTSSQIGSSRRNSSLVKLSSFDNKESWASMLPGEDAEEEQGGGRKSDKGERRLSTNAQRLSLEQNSRRKSSGNGERRLSTNSKKEPKVTDHPVTTVIKEKNQPMSSADKKSLSSNAKKDKRVRLILASGSQSAMDKIRRPLKENGQLISILKKKKTLKY